MEKTKKTKLIVIGSLEGVFVVFALIVSVLVMHNFHNDDPAANLRENGPFIGWLQNNNIPFLLMFVLPLFALLALDVIYLIVYATKRESSLSDSERAAIEEQARKEAREEVLREMAEENKAKE